MKKKINKDVEFEILQIMLNYYCKKNQHKVAVDALCRDCLNILEYSKAKVEACPYKNKKPSCRKCPCYCFDDKYKIKMKVVMRSSGLKTLLFYPLLTYRYYKRLTEI